MGDFNLPLKDQTDPDSISFRDILSQFGLRQHINETTHKLGGFLDLVITADNEQVRDLKVQPPTISDHAYIQFWLPHLHSQPLHAIRKTRGWRSLDRRMLSDALRSSQLSSSPSTLDAQTVDELFDLYTSTMNQLIDTMLPLRELKTRCRPLAVWFDSDCHQIRRRSRCLERRFRRTRDPADKLAWITQLRALHQLYRRKEAAYGENLVQRNEKYPKRLWTSISGLMARHGTFFPTASGPILHGQWLPRDVYNQDGKPPCVNRWFAFAVLRVDWFYLWWISVDSGNWSTTSARFL